MDVWSAYLSLNVQDRITQVCSAVDVRLRSPDASYTFAATGRHPRCEYLYVTNRNAGLPLCFSLQLVRLTQKSLEDLTKLTPLVPVDDDVYPPAETKKDREKVQTLSPEEFESKFSPIDTPRSADQFIVVSLPALRAQDRPCPGICTTCKRS